MNERNLYRVLLVVNLITFIFLPLCLLLLYQLRAILTPVLTALLLAYILYPIVAWGSRFGIPKLVMILGVVVLLIGSTILAGFSLKPALQQQLRFLFEDTPVTFPGLVDEAPSQPSQRAGTPPRVTPIEFDLHGEDGSGPPPPAEPLKADDPEPGDETDDEREEFGRKDVAEDGASDPERLFASRLQQFADRFLDDLRERGWLSIERTDVIHTVADYIAQESLAMLRSFTTVAVQWGRFLMIFLFVLIFALLDGDKFQRTIIQLMPNEFFESAVFVLHKTQEILGRYLRGLVVENLIIFVLAFLMLLPLQVMDGIPMLMALVIATIFALTNVIRIIGPIIGGIIGVVLALTVTMDPLVLTGIVAVAILIQLLDSVLILPLVMRDQVNIHPVICLLGIIAGGMLAGILGMVLAIPFISGIKVLYRVMSIEMQRFVAPGQYDDYTRE